MTAAGRLTENSQGPAGASLSLRGEEPHQLPQKRSLALIDFTEPCSG